MDFYIVLICFPIIFLGELPDKTMFANLLMATRGRPVLVWLGAAAAFTVHVVIAVAAGSVLFHLVPRRYVELVVAALFLFGAGYAWREGHQAWWRARTAAPAVAWDGPHRIRRDLPRRVG